MKKIIFLASIILTFASAVWAQTADRAFVRLSGEAVVTKDIITLGDVAKISGDEKKAARLKTISLGYAPNFGAVREIARERILLAAAAAGLTENDFSLDSLATIRVERAGQTVDLELLRNAVEKAVLGLFQPNDVTVKITNLDLPANLVVPVGKVEVVVNSTAVRNFLAPFAVAVEIKVDGLAVRKFAVSTQIEAYADILVAARDLTANSKINQTDVKFENKRLEKPIVNYVRDIKNLYGAITINNLPAGTELTTETIAPGIMIKNGDPVRIIAQSNKLQILVAGEARASGRIGDRIAVRNLQSNAVLQAVVIDEGVVQVRF